MELKLWTKHANLLHFLLLIVPYGIETTEGRIYTVSLLPFNRTLWN